MRIKNDGSKPINFNQPVGTVVLTKGDLPW